MLIQYVREIVLFSHPKGWKQSWTFVSAGTAAAVGLGNLWRFPYLLGEHGGTAFLVAYLCCLFFIAMPIVVAEVVLGRRGKAGAYYAMQNVITEGGRARFWQLIAMIGLLAALLILSYYSVVSAWSLAYLQPIAEGEFISKPVRVAGNYFQQLISDTQRLITYTTAYVILLGVLSQFAVNRVFAWAMQLLMPAFILALIMLAMYGMKFGDSEQANLFLFQWGNTNITAMLKDQGLWLAALGQAFFTLSIGCAVLMGFGAYAPDGGSLITNILLIVVLDTVVAILAGLAIFPLVFPFNMQPEMGPSLLFIALPFAFGQLPFGDYFGLIFFIMLSVIALSSGLALMEPLVTFVSEHFKLKRWQAALLTAAIIMVVAAVSICNLTLWQDIHFQGLTLFELPDIMVSHYLLPTGGLMIALFVGFRLRIVVLKDTLFKERPMLFWSWLYCLRFIAIPGIIVLFTNLIISRLG